MKGKNCNGQTAPAAGDEKMDRKNAKTPEGDQAADITKQTHEAAGKARALARAGANPNLNGHIQEVMGAHKTNLAPVNRAKGVRETLTETKKGRMA